MRRKAAHLRAQLFRNAVSVDTIPDDLRSDEFFHFSSLRISKTETKEHTDDRNILDPRLTIPFGLATLTDEAAEQNGLPVRH